MAEAEHADILHGYDEIGAFLRLSRRQAKHLAEVGSLPTFKLGSRIVHARRSTLNSWLAEQEAASRRGAA